MRRRSHDGRAGVQVRPGCDHESLIRKGPVMSAKTEEKSLLLEVWDALSFSEIRTAMRVVLKHMFVKPVTFQYPREKRSEEHTSELQSRLHLVCRLLLEKKKKLTHK